MVVSVPFRIPEMNWREVVANDASLNWPLGEMNIIGRKHPGHSGKDKLLLRQSQNSILTLNIKENVDACRMKWRYIQAFVVYMIYFREYGPTLLDSCYLFIHLADIIQSDLEQMTLIRCPVGRGSAPFSGRLTGGLCTCRPNMSSLCHVIII